MPQMPKMPRMLPFLEKKPDGFTLAELLIAIVIFSAVIGMVYTSYNITFKVINNADAHSLYGERARITLERFTEDLESYYAGKGGFIKGETIRFGEFRGDKLSFTSRSHLIFNKDEPARGYATIVYSVEEDEESGQLKLYRADIPYLPGVGIDDDEKGFLLCDGLREVAFTYLDKDGDEDDSWEGNERSAEGVVIPPNVVQLRIGFADEKSEDGTIYFSTGVAVLGGQ